jgi:hypothetical protein
LSSITPTRWRSERRSSKRGCSRPRDFGISVCHERQASRRPAARDGAAGGLGSSSTPSFTAPGARHAPEGCGAPFSAGP